MIFVTVGAQMPFDRLIAAVDRWARQTSRGEDVFAQVGDHIYRPSHIRYTKQLEPQAFRAKVESADLLVAHAGMGSILTALELGKPILVMPRRGDLKETRNDHQVATAKKLGAFGRVNVAMDEAELLEKLDQLNEISAAQQIGPHASSDLLQAVRSFIFHGKRRGASSLDAGVGLAAADVELGRHVSGGAVLANG